MEAVHPMEGSLHPRGQVVTLIHLSMDRCMGLIYKAISYISSKTSKYCKGETNISKDARVSKLVVDAKLMKILANAK